MSEEEANPSETLATLRTSLLSVEETLKPLLERKWAETTGELGTLERAKMDVLVSYAINHLIWVYLKMKGVDPSSHDVSNELERISTYYGKVKAIEEPESRRTTGIDKAAAGRFIAHSIPKRQRLPPTDTAPTSAAAIARKQAEIAVNESMGTSNRFRHIAKDDETERVMATPEEQDEEEEEEEEEEELEVEDEAEDLLNELQEQFLASNGQVEAEDISMQDDTETDQKKRKRAEDLNR